MSAPLPIAERIRLFNAGRLPGQGPGFHRGTVELIKDLWSEREQFIDTLRDVDMAMSNLPAAERKAYETKARIKIAILLAEARAK